MRKRDFMNMSYDDRRGLAFIVVMLVVTCITYGILSDKNSDVAQYNKDSHRSNTRRGGSPYVYKGRKGGSYYAQEDIGYGDGSVSASEVSLADRLFPFDPNTADSTTLLRLGLKPWQVRSIYRYRAHGGRFRQTEDFARLHGLTLAQYRRLAPYIRIRQEVMAADVVGREDAVAHGDGAVANRPATSSQHSNVQKLTLDDAKVDINTADTALLKRIPGIGSYFASRIVELRRRRKVFVTPEELLVIRNFPEYSLVYMTASHDFPPLRVNRMTQQELLSHPLLTHTQARDIIALRRSAGRIASVQDMVFITSFTAERLALLTPFLVFD